MSVHLRWRAVSPEDWKSGPFGLIEVLQQLHPVDGMILLNAGDLEWLRGVRDAFGSSDTAVFVTEIMREIGDGMTVQIMIGE